MFLLSVALEPFHLTTASNLDLLPAGHANRSPEIRVKAAERAISEAKAESRLSTYFTLWWSEAVALVIAAKGRAAGLTRTKCFTPGQ